MTDLGSRIIETLEKGPGQKAGQIASTLGVERQLVNSALYGRLKGRVRQDKYYRWYLSSSSGINKRENEGPARV